MTDPNCCAYCGKVFVVESLARSCEAKHEAAT